MMLVREYYCCSYYSWCMSQVFINCEHIATCISSYIIKQEKYVHNFMWKAYKDEFQTGFIIGLKDIAKFFFVVVFVNFCKREICNYIKHI